MQELLNLILEINQKTNYVACLRYTAHRINGTLLDDFAVDLTLDGANIHHEHHTDFSVIPSVMKNLKDAINQKTRYIIHFSDGTFMLNKEAATYDLALAEKKAIDERYGVNCKIKEVI